MRLAGLVLLLVLLAAAPASGQAVVVELHWGGFTRGSAADVQNEVDALRARGLEVVNYEYRLGIPLRVERDVSRFVRALRADHDEVYGETLRGAVRRRAGAGGGRRPRHRADAAGGGRRLARPARRRVARAWPRPRPLIR